MNCRLGLACALFTTLAACDGGDGEPSGPGADVFRNPVDDGNTFSCSTCHAISEPADDGIRRPGHPLGGATRRASYKNGQLPGFLDAVNSCLTEWMNADPWTADDPRFVSLSEFIDGQSGAEATVAYEIVQPPVDLSGGDVGRGADTFAGTCAVCHGTDGMGTNQAPAVFGRGLDPDLIGRRARTSGRIDSGVYTGLTGGVMPFWSADRLSDDELRDIVAWLGTTGEPPTTGDGGTTGDPPEPGNCGMTHEMVGWTAVLDGRFHDVAGTAQIIDDCTIEITEFGFDGGGIDVRVYGGLNGDYDAGFGMGDNLVRSGGYSGDTIRVTLPDGMTLDDLSGVSIWCVPVGVDFGSGDFTP